LEVYKVGGLQLKFLVIKEALANQLIILKYPQNLFISPGIYPLLTFFSLLIITSFRIITPINPAAISLKAISYVKLAPTFIIIIIM